MTMPALDPRIDPAAFVALYRGGAKMREIGQVAGGISPWKVARVLKEYGIRGDARRYTLDPLRVAGMCRQPSVRSWHMAARLLGVELRTARGAADRLELVPAIDRLFQWRRAHRHRARKASRIRTVRIPRVACGRGHPHAQFRTNGGNCRACRNLLDGERRRGERL